MQKSSKDTDGKYEKKRCGLRDGGNIKPLKEWYIGHVGDLFLKHFEEGALRTCYPLRKIGTRS